jgi:hypothetical protein
MKSNKHSIFVFTIFLGLASTSVLSQGHETQCKAIEFAEMQSMSKAELLKNYCSNLAKRVETLESANIQNKFANEMEQQHREIYRRYQITGFTGFIPAINKAKQYYDEAVAKTTAYVKQHKECIEENERILRIYNKDVVDAPSLPSCK